MAKRKRKKKNTRSRQIFSLFVTFVLVMTVLAMVLGLFLFERKSGQSLFACIREGHEVAAASTREDFRGGNITKILDSNGKTLAELSENNDSTYLEYDQIPENVINAFVAIEDRSFWKNNGTDPKGMVRVLWSFIKSRGNTAHGASTITQQAVKLTYLSSEKTLSRKVKEMVIAQDITKKYSKEEIIEFYCNICCFANGIFGIADASEKYFNKPASELTLSEAAYLCAIPNRPEYYNPRTNPENALKRRDKILEDMAEVGSITKEECQKAKAEDVASRISEVKEAAENSGKHNFETTYAIYCASRYLMSLDDEFIFRYSFKDDDDYEAYQEEYKEAYAQAKHALYTGGYTIQTSIDLQAQKKLQAILDEKLSDKTAKNADGIYEIQGSMTVIDNDTGKVVAVIGGRSQEETKGMYTLNRVFQGFQQPGSSIKPLVVYAPALNSGYNTNSPLNNISVDSAKKKSAKEIAEMSGDQVTLRYATEQSLNGCAYWLFANLGVKTGMSYLQEMEFSRITPSDLNMSACLGGVHYGMTTEEMATAYHALQNDGVYTDCDCIVSMKDKKGKEIYEAPEEKVVYSQTAARKMTDVMKGVLTNGTASKSKWYKSTKTEAAGKTGTTNDNKAAWFCGYTPYYTISVWVGCDTPKAIKGLTGGSYPLSIWKDSMLYLIQDKPTRTFDGMEEEEPIEEAECICNVLCEEEYIFTDCPVCSEDYTQCAGHPAECSCTERCVDDSLNESCELCVHHPDQCQAVELECICDSHCTATSVNTTCPVCQADYNNCEEPEEEDTPSDNPQEPESQEPESQKPESQKPESQKPESQEPESQKPEQSESQKPEEQLENGGDQGGGEESGADEGSDSHDAEAQEASAYDITPQQEP